MTKKVFLSVLLSIFLAVATLGAATQWWEGQNLSIIELKGLHNISQETVDDILYPYRGVQFSNTVYQEMEEELYAIEGVDFIIPDIQKVPETDELKLVLEFLELPLITEINYIGNEKVKSKDITEALATLAVGKFIDISKGSVLEATKTEVQEVYYSKGFGSVPVELSFEENTEANTVILNFTITEGIQSRIVEMAFEGNNHFSSAILKKQVTSKLKSLFNHGYLDEKKLNSDVEAIGLFYQTNGYIDVIVGNPRIEEVTSESTEYREVKVTFVIDEGQQWFYGGLEVFGNTIFSQEQINAVLSMKEGEVLNLETVQGEITAVADLYYNNGYINNGLNVQEERDDTSMRIRYFMTITEGSQAYIEQILINGLTKTKEYVMRRELTLNPGDVFSKAKLITSYQNLYNTGLLSDLKYDILYGKDENSVILDFTLTEGNQMDIQFGATFGGTLEGFPVSGFLQLSDKNLGGRGQDLAISTTLSPDTQSLSVTFGDDWVRDQRWSNSLSLGFSRSINSNELQLGSGSPRYNGRNNAWPLGYSSYSAWDASNNESPSPENLMEYNLLTFSAGWSTGYTFIYDFGRLSFSGGPSISINRAIFDKTKYDPFEDLINKYSLKWQFSNKLSLSVQWDGRDYVTNTTKGYVLGTGITYAGGLLGGLSNYIKLTGSAAGYLKLFSVTIDEEQKNIMLCASSSVNFMLPQFYRNDEDGGLRFHDPKLGATKNEMLYIDGMTIARGFSAVTDLSFLWDNMLEISYPLVKDVIQAELFVSGTATNQILSEIKNGSNWYFAAGGGIKLKIPGFPLGLYLVKNATYNKADGIEKISGSIFHNDKVENSGMSLCLAISTSLI